MSVTAEIYISSAAINMDGLFAFPIVHINITDVTATADVQVAFAAVKVNRLITVFVP